MTGRRGPPDRRGGRPDDRRPPSERRPDDRRPPTGERDDRERSDRRPPDDRRSFEPRPPRADGGDRVVYGTGPVRELVVRRPTAVKAIWVDPQRAGRSARDPVADIVVAARQAGIAVEDRDRTQLDRAAGEEARHQGVLAWLGPFAYADLDTLVGDNGRATDGLVGPDGRPAAALLVALDGVEDPRNLGAIIRSAYLLGAGGVIIPEHRAAQVTPVVAKASAGASELVPIAQVGNLVRALDDLRERGLWRVAVHAADGAQPIASIDGTLPLCLVVGAEGSGVRPLVAKNCDFQAIIPMARSAVGSFNVSVAAALALYEVARQRKDKAP